jgi:Ni/Fe-hydrogenase subunit HybB-like protein
MFLQFLQDGFKVIFKGGSKFYIWMTILTLIVIHGLYCYGQQLTHGLAITGMSDYVSWGLYISNFTFFVGIAAAAVILIVPLYVFNDQNFRNGVLIGEGLAVASLVMCLLYVVADMGQPQNLWHLIPFIGHFNWPKSMLAWDVIVLNGYLALNLFIPMYLLYKKYTKQEANKKLYLPFIALSIIWAVSIHTVTAFLYAGLSAKPFWNTSILGPRFLASAFSAGPALIAILLGFIQRYTDFDIKQEVINKLGIIITIAAQINLFLLFSELFVEFYSDSHHSLSAKYLFFGIDGHNALVPWIWTSIIVNVIATATLSIHKLRNNQRIFYLTSFALVVAIWIEKGLGLIIPGFIPNQMGQIVEYIPSYQEIGVTLGIASVGLIIMTCLVRVAIPIELGRLSKDKRTYNWVE